MSMKQIVIKLVVLAVLLGFGYGGLYIHQLLTGFYRDHPLIECIPEKIFIREYKAFRFPGDTTAILADLDSDDNAQDIQRIIQGIKKSRKYTIPSKIPWKYQLQLICKNTGTNNVLIAHGYVGLGCKDIQRANEKASLLNYRINSELFSFVEKLAERVRPIERVSPPDS